MGADCTVCTECKKGDDKTEFNTVTSAILITF